MKKNCLYCQKEFKTKPSHYERRKCCSYECARLYGWGSEEYRKNQIKKHLGMHNSPSTEFKKGMKKSPLAYRWKKGTSNRRGLNKLNDESVLRQSIKISIIMKKLYAQGKRKPVMVTKEAHWNWQGGVTPLNESIRKSEKYKSWRNNIFERDKYICQKCGIKNTCLNAHHIKPFSKYPELRFNLNNGITLCVECHKEEPNYGGRPKIKN